MDGLSVGQLVQTLDLVSDGGDNCKVGSVQLFEDVQLDLPCWPCCCHAGCDLLGLLLPSCGVLKLLEILRTVSVQTLGAPGAV